MELTLAVCHVLKFGKFVPLRLHIDARYKLNSPLRSIGRSHPTHASTLGIVVHLVIIVIAVAGLLVLGTKGVITIP